MPNLKNAVLVAAIATTPFLSLSAVSAEIDQGVVFTASNAVDNNEVIMFGQKNGHLRKLGAYATGGKGTGSGLGNQGGVALSDDHHWLLVVNAGSNQISSFKVMRHGIEQVDVVDSGGLKPISIALHNDIAYVVNADSDNITGFMLGADGKLNMMADSTHALSGSAVGPAQVDFNPTGDMLIVTEKSTNQIDVFPVDEIGMAGDIIINPSVGKTPFGLSFDHRGHLLVAEAQEGAADASTVSSYKIDGAGMLDVISGAIATTETAACWIITPEHSRYTFTSNTPSSSITALKVKPDGSLDLLDPDGVTVSTGSGSRPTDMATDAAGQYLFSLSAATGVIKSYRIKGNGDLKEINTLDGLPTSINGLAAY